MHVALFGSSLVSTYWTGAATSYRGIVRALAERGHRVTFYEPHAHGRHDHREIEDPPWAEVVMYGPGEASVLEMLERARGVDLVVKVSGWSTATLGVHDALLEREVLALRGPRTVVAFWDVDAPATLAHVEGDPADPLRALVPRFDLVLTYGGGPAVVAAYERLGARLCVPIANALDPEAHHPVPPDPRFAGSVALLGHRTSEREPRVDELFVRPAQMLPGHRFVLGGSGWDAKPLPANVAYVGHVYTRDHDAFHGSPLAVLDLARDPSPGYGFAPGTRVFEAAGAGACMITEARPGLEAFLEPEREILIAHDGDDVARHAGTLTLARARAIGEAARARVLREHTYAHRALAIEDALAARAPRRRTARAAARSARGRSIVVIGRAISSSWATSHANLYRGLVGALAHRGHDVVFLERDAACHAQHRDLARPPEARIALYASEEELRARFTDVVRAADLVIVGSRVPDGLAIGRWVLDAARGMTAFYDLDAPITLSEVARGTCGYLDRPLARRFGAYLSATSGPTLARIERELGAQRVYPLLPAVDPAVHAPDPRPARWDVGYLGTYVPDRQASLRRFLLDVARREPARRHAVVGARYPTPIEWPDGVDRIEHLAPADHAAFWGATGFALNLTRAHMIAAGWSPSARLFEAAACGVPIISDAWTGLDELFVPEAEVLIAHDTEDVLRYLHDLDERARRTIGARARVRVLAQHTAAHRAEQLEKYVWDDAPVTYLASN